MQSYRGLGHAPTGPEKILKLMLWDSILGHFQSNTDKVDKLYNNTYIY